MDALQAQLDSLGTFMQDQLGDLWGQWGELRTSLDSLIQTLRGGGPPPPDTQPTLASADTFSVARPDRLGVRVQFVAHGWDSVYVENSRQPPDIRRGAGDPATIQWAQFRPTRIPGPAPARPDGCTARSWAGNADGARSDTLTFDWCDFVLGNTPPPPDSVHLESLDVLPASFTIDVGQTLPSYAIFEMSDGRPYLCVGGSLHEALRLNTSYPRAAKPDSAAVRPNGQVIAGPCSVFWSSSDCSVLTVTNGDGSPGGCDGNTRARWREWYVASRP